MPGGDCHQVQCRIALWIGETDRAYVNPTKRPRETRGKDLVIRLSYLVCSSVPRSLFHARSDAQWKVSSQAKSATANNLGSDTKVGSLGLVIFWVTIVSPYNGESNGKENGK